MPVLDKKLLEADGQLLKAMRSGYVQNWNKSALERIASREHFIIRLEFQPGNYIVKGLPIISILNTGEKIRDEVKDAIMNELFFYNGERISENYHYGFTQLMEIAIKALSPSLNDPGTARLCLHNLTDLFRLRMEMGDDRYSCNDEGTPLLIWHSVSFDSLLYKVFAPIMNYGAGDVSICLTLLRTYQTLAMLDVDQKYKSLLQQHADAVLANMSKMDIHTVDKNFIAPQVKHSHDYLHLKLDNDD